MAVDRGDGMSTLKSRDALAGRSNQNAMTGLPRLRTSAKIHILKA